MRNRFSGQAGVALVEVLVCSAIVGIAAVGVALMLSSGQSFIEAEGDNREALYLGQQKIEQLRARGYAGLNTDGSLPGTGSEDPVPNHAGYSRTWSVVCIDRDNYTSSASCSAAGAAKKITVTVQTSPTDPKATPVTLEAVLASR